MIHIPAGPPEPVAKEDVPALVSEFAAAAGPQSSATTRSCTPTTGCPAWSAANSPAATELRWSTPCTPWPRSRTRPWAPVSSPNPTSASRARRRSSPTPPILTANTIDEAAELQHHYSARPEQLVVVPPGVDLHTFHPCDQPKSRAQLGIAQDAKVILFVGRIQPLKAPDVLDRSGRPTRHRAPGAARPAPVDHHRQSERTRRPGGPPPCPGWRGTLEIDDVVEFRPHSPRAELFRWYCASDVVGVPSHTESFGLVALEAQACGRPVVATDVGGLRHTVEDGHTGILVHDHDAERVGAGALRGARRRGRRNLARGQRRRARVPLQLGQHCGRHPAGLPGGLGDSRERCSESARLDRRRAPRCGPSNRLRAGCRAVGVDAAARRRW